RRQTNVDYKYKYSCPVGIKS
ncbi:hypothetical protein CCACVL1_00147, partial [Corchorus capsularis]